MQKGAERRPGNKKQRHSADSCPDNDTECPDRRSKKETARDLQQGCDRQGEGHNDSVGSNKGDRRQQTVAIDEVAQSRAILAQNLKRNETIEVEDKEDDETEYQDKQRRQPF